jgi:asparagine synthase (glutamine-hydrolysing)
MCGIVGMASAGSEVNPGLLTRMRDAMTHRGPDDVGAWRSRDRQVGLAHRRLSVIDLSPAGRQPMSYLDGRLWLVFNGELYNYRDLREVLEGAGHRFRSATDSEVLLAAYAEWGPDCVDRLTGMFAFAIYDQRERRLFLARDRAGEKPLFYVHRHGTFAFASELKALMCDTTLPRRLDLEAFAHYLTYGYVPGAMCMLTGVRKLEQGHAMRYDLETGNLEIRPYWSLPEPDERPADSPEELERELAHLLTDAVRRCLVADVPIGVLLSGGVDSSLVTAMAVRASNGPVRTFTVSFPGYGEYDEAPHARRVADYFGTRHTELVAEPASVELLPVLARQFDEPMADSSMIPTFLLSQLVRQHATVALAGDGGDELFGGYRHYNWLQTQERARAFLPRTARKIVGELAARSLRVGFRGRNVLLGLETTDRGIAHVNVFFDRYSRRTILSRELRHRRLSDVATEEYKARLTTNGMSLLQKATRVDFRSYLVDDILVKVDRASMLASLEVRAPLLDRRVIDFAFGRIPDRLRATATQRKVLLQAVARKLLPPGFDFERKQGFSLPLNTWLRGEWRDSIQDIIENVDTTLFDRNALRGLMKLQLQGYANAQRLFAVAMFELWRHHYGVGTAA